MKRLRFIAVLTVFALVAAACSGSVATETQGPDTTDESAVAVIDPIEVRDECDDVGSFVAAVFSIAEQVSDTDTSSILLRWRLMPTGTIRFAISPGVDDLTSDYYDFYAWNSLDGESGIQETRFVGESRNQVYFVEDPAIPLDQQLCGALNDLEDYVGVSAENGKDTLKSVQSFYEIIFGLTQELWLISRASTQSMMGGILLAADEGVYVNSEDEGRFAVIVWAGLLENETDSRSRELILIAEARADALGSALARIVDSLDKNDPMTWVIGKSRAEENQKK